jgi:hypothetical protein
VVNPAKPPIVTKNAGALPGQKVNSSIHSMIAGQTERATRGKGTECGKNVATFDIALVANRGSTVPMIYRARRMPRLEIRPSGRTPGVFFICTKGGRGGAGPDPHTNHSRNFRLEDPPQFFGQIFWEKILEIKIVLLASPMRGC